MFAQFALLLAHVKRLQNRISYIKFDLFLHHLLFQAFSEAVNHLLPVSIRCFKHFSNLREMVYVTVQWIVFIKLHLNRLVLSYFIVQIDLTRELLFFASRKSVKKLHLFVLHKHIIVLLDLGLVGQCVLRAAHHHPAYGFSSLGISVLRLELVQNIIDGWRPFII